MSLDSETSSVAYTGNNSAVTAYAVTFKFFENADLTVIVTDSSGVETTLVLDTDYTVTGAGEASGGTVVTAVAYDNTNTVTIVRLPALTQPYNFEEGQPSAMSTMEEGLDRFVMQVQAVDYKTETQIPAMVTAAEAAQTAAELAETNAAASEAAAASSESNAATSESNAGTSETNAAASAAAASTSESNAATSESNAAASETAAGLSETAAAASETAAGLSETAAAASELDAENAAISAAASIATAGIDVAAEKTTPVDADLVGIADSAAAFVVKKLTFANLWTWIKAKIESVVISTLEISGDLTVDTNTLHVDSVTNRVGIGTATPDELLHLAGSQGDVKVWDEGNLLEFTRNGGNYIQASNASGSLTLTAGGTITDARSVSLNTAGNFGVGTTSPTSKLTVDGTQSFIGNSGTWDGSTLAGDQTLTGQIEATGQAATTDDSVMTRGLGDARYGRVLTAIKEANEARASTTTLAQDTDLTISSVPVGRYRGELSLQTYDNSNGGFKYAITTTGTTQIIPRAKGLKLASATAWGQYGTGVVSEDLAPWPNATKYAQVWFEIKVTATADIYLEWAQNTSSATSTTLFDGAYLTLTKLD